MTTTTDRLPPRGAWMRCLLAVDSHRITACAADLGRRYTVQHRALPTAGLAMLQLREPNRGERFNLGELPLAGAEVDVVDAQGVAHPGAAQVMHDDEHLAQALAVCDAVLAAGLDGAADVATLVTAGAAACAREDRIRAGLLHRTAVEFDLLEEADDDDEKEP